MYVLYSVLKFLVPNCKLRCGVKQVPTIKGVDFAFSPEAVFNSYVSDWYKENPQHSNCHL